jgi:hypothetical protein
LKLIDQTRKRDFSETLRIQKTLLSHAGCAWTQVQLHAESKHQDRCQNQTEHSLIKELFERNFDRKRLFEKKPLKRKLFENNRFHEALMHENVIRSKRTRFLVK